MIRVLQFANIVNRYDFIDNIVRWADPSRFEVGVCVRDTTSNIAEPCYGDDVPHWALDGPSRRDAPRATVRLAALLKRWQVDVLHTHHYDQAVIGWAATQLYPKTRQVVGRHYSDAIYRSTGGLKKRALLGVEQVVNHAAARIVVPSTMIRDLLTVRQGISPEKVDVVPYGFVAEKYAPPDPVEVGRLRAEVAMGGDFLLGNFSRLHEEKGHRYLVEAIARLHKKHPGLRLVIVGEGAERSILERQIERAGLSGVIRLLGWRRDAMALMAAVDAVVQPTLQEAFSQVMAEALWMGRPLVITDVSGATDIIKDGDNGLLVPKEDVDALAMAVERVATDQELRRRLADRGQEFVRNELNIESIAKLYENAYERALGKRRQRCGGGHQPRGAGA